MISFETKERCQEMIKLHLNLVSLLAPGFKNNKVKCSFDGIFSFEMEIQKEKDNLQHKFHLLDEATILFSVCNETVGIQDTSSRGSHPSPKEARKRYPSSLIIYSHRDPGEPFFYTSNFTN